ncbi:MULTISPECIES: hypothetical protein [unclassified Streptomyces]|uniref:hypothetical protein n=1 Tax=unclassified Streptomyces TaxID=2593676 RepID=UPI00344DE0D7
MPPSQVGTSRSGGWCPIRNLIIAETARAQFEALPKSQKDEAEEALLRIAQEAKRHGVWRAGGDPCLTVTYEVRPSALLVVEISTAQPRPPAGPRPPYQGMEMRYVKGKGWIELNPHEE